MQHKMALHDLKQSKADKRKAHQPMPLEASYPWSTQMDLGAEVVEKIPELKNAEVGDRIHIEALAVVTRKQSTEVKGGKEQISVELQITKMGCCNQEEYSASFKEASKK